MEEKFRSKQLIALLFVLFFGLSALYSILIKPYKPPILREEIKVTSYDSTFKTERVKNGTNYFLEFQFVGIYDSVFIIGSTGLKYSRYKKLRNDIHSFDTLLVQFDKRNHIYSLSFRGENYLNKEKIITSEKDHYQFEVFFNLCLCLSASPILFFKRTSRFAYQGKFSFAFLFLAIMAISLSVYFYFHGVDYLASVDIADLK